MVGQLLPIFNLFAMPLHEVLSVDLQMLHAFFVHHALPFVVVVSEVVLIFVFVGALGLHEPLSPEK